MESSESNNPADSFVCYVELPSLQEIASYQIALAIRYNGQSRRFINPNDFERHHQKYDSQVGSLITPSVIKDVIKSSVKKIEKELCAWLDHFTNVLFCGSREPFKVQSIDVKWCVWLPNGEIDYLKTGMKMLKSEKLTQRQKFLIMCEYCMEDEIKKLSLDRLPADYIKNTDHYANDGILLYWICFLKNTSHEVPLQTYVNFHRYARFSVEYFWHRIGVDDQLIVVSQWISKRFNTHFEYCTIERLISKMSLHQQQRLLAQKSLEILNIFLLHSRPTQCILWAWEYCKGTMLDEQFVRLIKQILVQWRQYEYSSSAMHDIWETANDNQKLTAATSLIKMVIQMYLFEYDHPKFAFHFVKKFSALIPPEDRKGIICDFVTKIGSSHSFDLSFFNEIMNVCLPSSNANFKLIKTVICKKEMIVKLCNLIHKREFERLNAAMKCYFSQKIEEARAFQIKLLKSLKFEESNSIVFVSHVDEWRKLEKYIDEILSNNSVQALKEKQRLIKSAIMSNQYRYNFNLHRDVQETLKIVEMVFANEELKNIKRLVARSFGESLKTHTYWENEKVSNETYFEEIINWCLGNDEETILDFKTRVSEDTIFQRIFSRINNLDGESGIEVDYLEGLLERLNEYLKWYLASDDEVKIFKLSKLNESFKQLKIFRSVSNRKDGQFLDILLKWFFDGDDEEQIRMFRSSNFRF